MYKRQGLEVAGNILSGIFHPSAKLLFTLGTDGVPYLLLETFCIAFLGKMCIRDRHRLPTMTTSVPRRNSFKS